jgi:hypothetical protein
VLSVDEWFMIVCVSLVGAVMICGFWVSWAFRLIPLSPLPLSLSPGLYF